MKFYTSTIIIIFATIIFYSILHCWGPENLALKTMTMAQSDNTRSSNSQTTIPDNTSIGSNLTLQEVQQLLQLHNEARADVGVAPLHWSEKLAIYAQAWADHLASTNCRMEHRPHSGKWKQEHGENLFMGTAGYYSVSDAVKAWESEKIYYGGGTLNPSNWYDSGHYTQVVWTNTKQVGCAKVECNGEMIVVCNYDPPGNVLGQKPY
jgi:pathogenesis-related protein 1